MSWMACGEDFLWSFVITFEKNTLSSLDFFVMGK